MYDPIELAYKTEQVVTKGSLKRYYRFRGTRFYGGIATADTVGCNLRCIFCWSGNSVWHASSTGELYSPRMVVDHLEEIAENKGFHQMRISGGEPTIGKQHLLDVLWMKPASSLFILETNGILLGVDKSYVEELEQVNNLHVRVCLKGCSSEEFSWLTGASSGFEYQLQALSSLKDCNVSFHIALISVQRDIERLKATLEQLGLEKIMIEEEMITLYPQVKARLKRLGKLEYFQ